MNHEYYIGVMSGTSIDAIDCALVDFANTKKPELIAFYSQEIPENIKNPLLSLISPQFNEIQLMSDMDTAVAQLISRACLQLLDQSNILAKQVQAIGSHGQTIRHYPDSQYPNTLQLGNPNIIAYKTGIKTIADFRRADMAAGGQGAPLVPAFHQALYGNFEQAQTIVNIGGIANISCLRPGINMTGYDTGPGNCLMDEWARKYFNRAFDDQGQIAASGKVDEILLKQFLTDPYFTKSVPKSTGREYFNQNWLGSQLNELNHHLNEADMMRTLLELTVQSIYNSVNQSVPQCERMIVCGGGSKNKLLMKRLQQLCNFPVLESEQTGIDSKTMESMAFAWLARQNQLALPGNIPSVTGAKKAVVLGAVYTADA